MQVSLATPRAEVIVVGLFSISILRELGILQTAINGAKEVDQAAMETPGFREALLSQHVVVPQSRPESRKSF